MSQDVTKLPKWAQQYIINLEADVTSLKKRLKTVEGNKIEPGVEIFQSHIHGHTVLSKDPVSFVLNKKTTNPITRDNITIYLERNEQYYRPCIKLYGSWGLEIRPIASNVVYVYLEEKEWGIKNKGN